MNQKQFKIIELATKKDIWSMSLREIGREIGEKNAGTVKYHLDQLLKKKILKKQDQRKLINKYREILRNSSEALLNIPILGAANCGEATLIGEEVFNGYLKVSPGLIPGKNYDSLFAIEAQGNSLNQARIKGEGVESGDYLIVDTNLQPQNGSYVLSVLDGCANVKKFRDEKDRIVLEAESSEKIPPIFIDKKTDYLVNGVVIKVIKRG